MAKPKRMRIVGYRGRRPILEPDTRPVEEIEREERLRAETIAHFVEVALGNPSSTVEVERPRPRPRVKGLIPIPYGIWDR